jgi:hypothetical protein
MHIGQIFALRDSHDAVLTVVLARGVALHPSKGLRHHAYLIHHLCVSKFSSPVALFPTRMHVYCDVRGAEALAGGSILINDDFARHIPIPLINLARLQTQALLQLNDLAFVPDWVSLELDHQDFILQRVLPDSFLCFLSSFTSVANNYAGHKAWR